ncbi:hypothetical protein Emag_006366 [Eimeria magna]
MLAREEQMQQQRQQEEERECRRIEAHKQQTHDKATGSAWDVVSGALRDPEKARQIAEAAETKKAAKP